MYVKNYIKYYYIKYNIHVCKEYSKIIAMKRIIGRRSLRLGNLL